MSWTIHISVKLPFLGLCYFADFQLNLLWVVLLFFFGDSFSFCFSFWATWILDFLITERREAGIWFLSCFSARAVNRWVTKFTLWDPNLWFVWKACLVSSFIHPQNGHWLVDTFHSMFACYWCVWPSKMSVVASFRHWGEKWLVREENLSRFIAFRWSISSLEACG